MARKKDKTIVEDDVFHTNTDPDVASDPDGPAQSYDNPPDPAPLIEGKTEAADEKGKKQTYSILSHRAFINGLECHEGDEIDLTEIEARKLTDADVRLSVKAS